MNARQSKATTAANRRLVALMQQAFDQSDLRRDQLAEQSGVPDGTLAKIFSGRAPVYADQLAGIAKALGASPTEWLDEMLRARADHIEDDPEV